jgi:23S rRNA G2445 N2-methylase RlmL
LCKVNKKPKKICFKSHNSLLLKKLFIVSENKYVAKTLQGLEDVLAGELIQCGAAEVTPGRRAVEFSADKKTMYSINYRIFTALRILESFHSFRFTDVNDYYDQLRALPWKNITGPDDPLCY